MGNNEFIKRIIKNMLSTIVTGSPYAIELFLSLLSLWWGFILLFDNTLGIRFYDIFLLHGPRLLFSAIFLTIGSGMGIGRALENTSIERFFVGLSIWVWSFVTGILFVTRPLGYAAFGTYAIIVMFGIWAFWRLRYE